MTVYELRICNAWSNSFAYNTKPKWLLVQGLPRSLTCHHVCPYSIFLVPSFYYFIILYYVTHTKQKAFVPFPFYIMHKAHWKTFLLYHSSQNWCQLVYSNLLESVLWAWFFSAEKFRPVFHHTWCRQLPKVMQDMFQIRYAWDQHFLKVHLQMRRWSASLKAKCNLCIWTVPNQSDRSFVPLKTLNLRFLKLKYSIIFKMQLFKCSKEFVSL